MDISILPFCPGKGNADQTHSGKNQLNVFIDIL